MVQSATNPAAPPWRGSGGRDPWLSSACRELSPSREYGWSNAAWEERGSARGCIRISAVDNFHAHAAASIGARVGVVANDACWNIASSLRAISCCATRRVRPFAERLSHATILHYI